MTDDRPNPYKVRLADLDPVRPMTRNSDPDGNEPPGTATAYVAEIPKVRPNPNTIEGMIAGFGSLASAATGDDPKQRRRARTMAGWLLGTMLLGTPIGYVISRAFG